MRQGISFSARIAILLFIALLFLFLFIKMIVIPYLSIKDGYPVDIRQKAQFHSIEAAVELFDSQFKGHPPSDGNDVTGSPYCGAMKLAEAMMGQDLMGYHPKSAFRADGLEPNTHTLLYVTDTAKDRPGPFLPIENACKSRNLLPYDPECFR